MMIKIDKYHHIDSDDLSGIQYDFFRELMRDGYTSLAKSYVSKVIKGVKYVGTEPIKDYYDRIVTEDKVRRSTLIDSHKW